jgi:transglutaminase-like putative cysteine protease
MNRREFLHRSTLAAAALAGSHARAQQGDNDGWRRFEVTTRIEVLRPVGRTRVWLPTPMVDAVYQRTSGDTYRADGGFVEMLERPADSLDMLVAEWPAGVAPLLTVVNRVATREHSVDLVTPSVPPPLDLQPLERYMRGTRLIPVDGIVKSTADRITRGAGTDGERARAIYDWIVENTFHDPQTRGAGVGDVRLMLESGRLGGKCADITALFVGLSRAAGIPARDVYGLRVGRSANATRAQHCRAEVYLTGFGWVPVDPADVRAAMLEEQPSHRPIDDADVRALRARLFGSWEMNWIVFNYAHDVALPGAKRGPIGFFMYPQAETADGRIDSLDPEALRYDIAVRED